MFKSCVGLYKISCIIRGMHTSPLDFHFPHLTIFSSISTPSLALYLATDEFCFSFYIYIQYPQNETGLTFSPKKSNLSIEHIYHIMFSQIMWFYYRPYIVYLCESIQVPTVFLDSIQRLHYGINCNMRLLLNCVKN